MCIFPIVSKKKGILIPASIEKNRPKYAFHSGTFSISRYESKTRYIIKDYTVS